MCVVVVVFASLSAEPLHGSPRMVSHGSPFRLNPSDPSAHARGPSSGSSVKEHNQPAAQQGVSELTKGAPQVGPKPRINHDVAREMAQTKVSRPEKAAKAMGAIHGPAVEVVKAELMKARTALEETVGGRRSKRVPQVHHNGGEAHQGVGH